MKQYIRREQYTTCLKSKLYMIHAVLRAIRIKNSK